MGTQTEQQMQAEQKKRIAEMRELIKKEYSKCARSPAYFMRKYCKIQHPLKGLIDFNLFDFQEDTVQEFLKYR